MEIDIGDTALGCLIEEKKRNAYCAVKKMNASELVELEATIAQVKKQNRNESDDVMPHRDAV